MQANCDWLILKIEDLEFRQNEMTEDHTSELATLWEQLQHQRLNAVALTEDRDR
jgi:hypothetical protein